MRSALLLTLLLTTAAIGFVPAASAGWTVVCAPKLDCVAGVCVSGCGSDALVCFAVGNTAPPACILNPCPPQRCYPEPRFSGVHVYREVFPGCATTSLPLVGARASADAAGQHADALFLTALVVCGTIVGLDVTPGALDPTATPQAQVQPILVLL